MVLPIPPIATTVPAGIELARAVLHTAIEVTPTLCAASHVG